MCDEALKSMVLDLSRVRALPISYKPKLKKKYFELYWSGKLASQQNYLFPWFPLI